MPKSFEQRLAYLEKLITDFFTASERSAINRKAKRAGKKASKATRKVRRRTPNKSRNKVRRNA